MRHLGIRTLAPAALAALTLACSSLPPAQPAQDLTTITGQWRGTMSGRSGSTTATMTITPDGRYQTVLDQSTPMGSVFPGTVKVEDGKFRYRSDRTGSTGTLTLHEAPGQRVLSVRADNNMATGELTPVEP
jgi:hypothetical protein